MSERKEALMRIVVAIVSGIIIIGLWGALIKFLILIHWIYAFFANKRSKTLGEFCNIWNTQAYRLFRYSTFATNKRPFPFTELGKVIDPYDGKMK